MPAPAKILLVDDEVHIRKYIGLIIRTTFPGSALIEATNGNEAIATYQTEKPDLVLLDINMPVRDGLEALEEIMTADPDAVVIMLTSVSTRAAVEKASNLGAVGYLLKDTPQTEIKATLQQLANDIFGEA